jgi:hypothetical protein
MVHKSDPFLTIVRPPDVTDSPLSPQFNGFANGLEMQLGPLPNSWSIRLSSDKRVYFLNTQTGQTTWQDPRLSAASPMITTVMDVDESEGCCSLEERLDLMSISTGSHHSLLRVSQWVAEERSEVRARNAKMLTLRSRARMARMQKHMQPLQFQDFEEFSRGSRGK